ncbi:zinc transporter ZntB [Sphingosinithalassobacter sp. CS137]|uniref:zinc transporter ZntB n=1 Tax=Sphingosinithalassobacter sp. CS137 TaxID=2762748 RepID=UPI00165D9899|nr:zinc transporter ZntB [Sphingosinithalassobacter sp. CS137]
MSDFAYSVHDAAVRRLSAAEALGERADLVWIHLTSADETARRWLDEEAKLPPILVEALTAVETRPRCDAVNDGAVINLRGLSSETMAASDPLASIRLYAHEGRVFSVTRKSLNVLDPVCGQVAAGGIHDPGDLIAALALAITEELDPVVADLGDSLDACEEQLAPGRSIELRRHVAEVRSRAIGYRRFLVPQRAALEKLAGLPGDWLRDDDRLHLAAASDRAARMAEEVESIRERAALIHETLTDLRAEQIDQRALAIAVVAMVFLPLTFLTGLLGMNVEGIPFAERPWAFAGVVGVCALLAVVIAGFFGRRHWLRR